MLTFTLTIGGQTKKSRFAQRSFGEAAIDAQASVVTIGDKTLPPASVEFLVKYGLVQYIADGGAVGKDGDETDFIDGTNARLENLLSGEFKRAKGEGGPIDNVETLARRNARAEILTAIKAAIDGTDAEQAALAKALKADKDRLATTVAAHFDNGKAAFMAAAKAEIDARHKTAGKIDLQGLLAPKT